MKAGGPEGRRDAQRTSARSSSLTDGSSRWVGTLHATKQRFNKWLIAGYRAQGSFWFTVAPDGTVSGHAVVAYEPIVDVSGANDILGYAQSIGAATLGAVPVPWVGMLGELAVEGLMGFKAVLPNPMPTKEGGISGKLEDIPSLSHPTLSLGWADGESLGIPMRFEADYLKHRKLVTEESFPTDSPWPEKAQVTEHERVLQAVAKSHTQDSGKKGKGKDNDVSESESTYWGAHRVTH